MADSMIIFNCQLAFNKLRRPAAGRGTSWTTIRHGSESQALFVINYLIVVLNIKPTGQVYDYSASGGQTGTATGGARENPWKVYVAISSALLLILLFAFWMNMPPESRRISNQGSTG